MPNRREGAFGSPSFVVVCAVALLLTGIAVGVAVVPKPAPDSLAPTATVDTVPIVEENYSDIRTVTVTSAHAPDFDVVSPADGVVTSMKCTPGVEWVSGTSPFAMNGRPKLLLSTAVPLWRDLERGDRGSDVLSLQKELTRLGKPVAATALFDRATQTAVASLFRDNNVSSQGTLFRSTYSWISAPTITISECAQQLGVNVGAGEAVATVTGKLVSLTVSEAPQGLIDGERELKFGEVSVAIGEDFVVTNVESLATISATDEFRAFAATDEEAPLVAQLLLVSPVVVASVPPSSIVFDAGVACVTSGAETHRVIVVASTLGRSIVTFDGRAPTEIDFTPSGATCG
jgi:peptidoglycan hydrolase-like protein with peptidoglycan-binding domain